MCVAVLEHLPALPAAMRVAVLLGKVRNLLAQPQSSPKRLRCSAFACGGAHPMTAQVISTAATAGGGGTKRHAGMPDAGRGAGASADSSSKKPGSCPARNLKPPRRRCHSPGKPESQRPSMMLIKTTHCHWLALVSTHFQWQAGTGTGICQWYKWAVVRLGVRRRLRLGVFLLQCQPQAASECH